MMSKMKKLPLVAGSAILAGAMGIATWVAAQVVPTGCTKDKLSTGMFVGEVRRLLCQDGSGGSEVKLNSDGASNSYTVRTNLAKNVAPNPNRAEGFITLQSGSPACTAVDTDPSAASKVEANCIVSDANPAVNFSIRVGDNAGN
ncbi:MAG: hypothetical protein ABI895_13195 [Deltaproteobacteria bacterium]